MKIIFEILLLSSLAFNACADLLFEENFDDQVNWAPGALVENSDSLGFTGTVPKGWSYYLVHELWNSDLDGSDAQPSISINDKDPNKVFGGKGKALIKYNESALTESNNFASDGFLTVDIKPSNEVYIEFRIKFQPNFAADFPPPPPSVDQQFLLKLVRVLHYDGSGSRSQFFSMGNSAPIYIYDWGFNQYGLRNLHSFRCDSQETNYKCTDPNIIDDYPRSASGASMSANYTSDIYKFDPLVSIPDLVNGGYLPTSGNVSHDQVFGNIWHKVAFYLKLNSAAGMQDGVLMQWLDGRLLVELKHIPWIGYSGDMNALWNSVSFGGNAHFHFNLDELAPKSERERWYAIDEIKIYNAIPITPLAPKNLKIN